MRYFINICVLLLNHNIYCLFTWESKEGKKKQMFQGNDIFRVSKDVREIKEL